MAVRSNLLRANGDSDQETISLLRRLSSPLEELSDLDPLLRRIGSARIVLLGEASHGTNEFYTWRQRITARLIRERGFSFVAVEGDWPDCYHVNRYVKSYKNAERTARDALEIFDRWPTWMWANEEVLSFVEWLKQHNNDRPAESRVGLFGLDVYSLWESLHAVLSYVDGLDESTSEAARRAFECFEPYGDDVQRYARASQWLSESCSDEVVELLHAVQAKLQTFPDDREARFNLEQNALIAKHAEEYYRTMVRGDVESWNIRDDHMMQTLVRLLEHHGPQAKAVVWAHNTHIGDARATDMHEAGMVNLGSLCRERYGDRNVCVIGFSTHRGHVLAARAWDAAMEAMPVPTAASGSWDDLLHQARPRGALLLLDDAQRFSALHRPRGQRAIGVVYRPQFERFGNYVPTDLACRYDALLHVDQTHAVRPLQLVMRDNYEEPETYPFAV